MAGSNNNKQVFCTDTLDHPRLLLFGDRLVEKYPGAMMVFCVPIKSRAASLGPTAASSVASTISPPAQAKERL